MITETDPRVQTTSRYGDDFRKVINQAFQTIKSNVKQYEEYDYGMDRVQKHKVIQAFDELIYEMGGFELDGRTLRHAHGIGNNSEYDVVDKDLVKVGTFYCNDDMFGGVYTGATLNGETIEKYHLK